MNKRQEVTDKTHKQFIMSARKHDTRLDSARGKSSDAIREKNGQREERSSICKVLLEDDRCDRFVEEGKARRNTDEKKGKITKNRRQRKKIMNGYPRTYLLTTNKRGTGESVKLLLSYLKTKKKKGN